MRLQNFSRTRVRVSPGVVNPAALGIYAAAAPKQRRGTTWILITHQRDLAGRCQGRIEIGAGHTKGQGG